MSYKSDWVSVKNGEPEISPDSGEYICPTCSVDIEPMYPYLILVINNDCEPEQTTYRFDNKKCFDEWKSKNKIKFQPKIEHNEWDIRLSDNLVSIFDRSKPYWFNVGKEKAERIVIELSRLYNISSPNVVVNHKILRGFNAMYLSKTKTIVMYSRNHAKSIFHEFYHHLDTMTDGLYRSDDKQGREDSLSWQFAELLWSKIREKLTSFNDNNKNTPP